MHGQSAQLIDRSCVEHIHKEVVKEEQAIPAMLESNKVMEAMAEFDKEEGAVLHSDGVTDIHLYPCYR